ncbi:hypothetical protein ACFV00_04605 [Streptomyces californicus]|uniref:hypothetical protein n=1 Tax=Streptomyces californicus TaxID=67351 RepID=UPI00368E4257
MTAIVGQAGVDVVPYVENFHQRLSAAVLPSADRVGRRAGDIIGERLGEAIGRHMLTAIPSAINHAGQAAQAASRRQGDQNAGAFASSMRRHLTAAFRSMPHLDVRITATGADAELARLRAKLEQLSNKRVGIDISAEAARAEIERIERELERLGASHPNVQVRADTAAARAALVAMREEIDAVDRRDIRVPVDVDTSRATSALMALGIQMGATAAIPLGPIIAAGLGAVVTAAAAAGAGVGALALVAVPAIKEVTSTLQLKRAAEDEASRATERSATSNAGAASKALQLAGAQAQLATAHRNAAQSIAAAERQVEAARRAVGEAAQRAAEQQQSAADGVRRAEQSLTDAKRSARDAEAALTQAREDAAAQLARLSDRLIDGHLDQREATLRVQQAQETLNETLKDAEAGKATRLQVEAAQLAYDRAKQNAAETKQSFEELTKSAAKQRRAGIEGSDAVKDATERVAQAQRGVSDQTNALSQAHAAAAKAAVDGSRAVAAAQERVSQATANVANAQASAADSIASAQRSIQSAQATTTTTTAAATTQQDAYRKALAAMTPAARDLFNAISGPAGLSEAFKAWSRELQPDVLPLFTRGVDAAKNSLPGLTPLVKSAAEGVGELFDSASAELKTPFWQQFKDGIATGAEPAIVGLGKAVGNVFKGIAGIIDAFLPHLDGVASGADNVTAKFAKWGTSLKGSPEFENFLKYTKENAPIVGKFVGEVLSAVIDFTTAVAPMSAVAFAVLSPLFNAISWLSTEMPGLIQTLWALYAVNKLITVGMASFGVAMGIYNTAVALAAMETFTWAAALQMTGIVPLITAIVVVIAALAAGVVWAYKNVEWFRTAVDTAWAGIKAATSFLWGSVLKPAFDGIWTGLKAIGSAAMWLWENALSPVFGFIAKWGKILLTALVTAFLVPAFLAVKALGAIATWLWDKAIGPAFRFIAAGATWLWQKVLSPVFNWIGDGIKWLYTKYIQPYMQRNQEKFEDLAKTAKWLWHNVISPMFAALGAGAKDLYSKHLKPAFRWMRTAIGEVADSFETAKGFIEDAWSEVADVAKEPIKIVVDTVYNGGIVPVWNAVAKITGADELKPLKLDGYYTGGILSGYSPGRDDRVIAVGGGEAILRPEVTRALGHDPINTWNAAARSGGVGAVQKAIANGMPAFADGGIVDKLWGGMKSVGSSIASGVKGTADFLTNPDKVFNAATGWAKEQMREFASSRWGQMVTKIPIAMLKSLKNAIFGGDGSGTSATGSVGKALMWARTKHGMPYQWGGAGNPSFDCSGFMSSIQKVILGQIPKGRLWSTFSFQGDSAPAGWVRNLRSPFQIGITNTGVGHTAGTLAGVNVESRGGDGVVVGKGARGWNDSLFTHHYGFAPAIGKKIAGYASGGFPNVGEFAWVGEQGPELVQFLSPTQVHSNADSVSLARSMQSIPAAGTQAEKPVILNQVFIGDKDITDIVDQRVTVFSDATAASLAVRRYL